MDDISRRKGEHLRLAATDDAVARSGPGFDDVRLVHRALPEVDFERLDPSVELLGHRLRLPLVVASMTGGHPDGAAVNATLARVVEGHGLAMGVGSQRAALRDPSLAETYRIARREAPTALLMANVGAAQLVVQRDESPLTPGDVARLAEMIGADAVIVHLNALQELIQPEGDRNGAGWLEAIGGLVRELSVPVVAKETGGGLSEADARRLAEAGVAAIDVGGRGGTSFAAIEGIRADERGDARGVALAGIFGEWGIPTAASVVVAARAGVPVIATGGVRSGLDAARALALGAVAVGVARPLLQAARTGDHEVAAWIGRFRNGLLGAMFLTGSATAADVRRAPYILGGETESWVQGLG